MTAAKKSTPPASTTTNNNNNNTSKRINSYNRLLNAGFIKKEVFDNRVNKLTNGVPPSTKPPTQQATGNSSTKPPTQQAAGNSSTKPKSSLAEHVLTMKGPISNFSGQYPCNGAPGRSLR